MDIVSALGATLGVVLVATLAGLGWRVATGRARGADAPGLATIAERHGGALGAQATLLQFSTELCTPCRATRRMLTRLATERDGVRHVEVDLDAHPDLAREFGILQTPTTFVLDGEGRSVARIGGAPRMPALLAVLAPLAEVRDDRVAA